MVMPTFSFHLQDFVFVWWALLYEALPFVAIGALMAGVLERCVSREAVVRCFPKNPLWGIAACACLGLVFPMCECGVVPVVRRLIGKGVPISCAVAYMLASPVINPLVIASTAIAFRNKGQWTVVGLRMGMTYVVAVIVAGVVWRVLGEQNLLRGDRRHSSSEPACQEHDHEHEHEHARGNMLVDALTIAAEDFLQIGATLVVGAALAALINSGFSRTAMEPFADNPLMAVSGMSLLAVVLNLCSEADAFVAASFYAFPLAAKMAFLVLGPMVDMKLLLMYSTVFRPKAILTISGVTFVLIWVMCVSGYLWMPAISATATR
jgi:uncharacterized protein